MNTPARISTRRPVPELLALVRALAEADAIDDVARRLAKPDRSDRQAAA
jgi:hypothetical protein